MQCTRIACPSCGKGFKTVEPLAPGSNFRCPNCLVSFDVQEKDFLPEPGASAASIILSPAARDGSPILLVPAAAPSPPPAPRRNSASLVALSAGVLVLAVSAGLAIGLTGQKRNARVSTPVADKNKKTEPRPDAPLPEPPQKEPVKPASEPLKKEDQTEPKGPRLSDLPPASEPREPIASRDPAPPRPPEPAARTALPPEKQAEVNSAIDKGVAYLRRTQTDSGSWLQGGQHAVGLAALPALTLLECGVPHEDQAVQRALAFVRREGPREMMTYDISLAILFLDRYGDPRDRRLIQTLGLRLMAGQQPSGGWTYHCRDVFTPKEELVFFDLLQQTRPKDPLQLFDRDRNDSRMQFFVNSRDRLDNMAGRLEAPLSAKLDGGMHAGPLFGQFAPKVVGKIESTSPNAATIPLEQIKSPKTRLQDVPQKLHEVPILKPIPASKDLPSSDTTDNSNTQFAILGVWAAARHNIPMERTLAMLVKRFRVSQNADGSWGYHFRAGGGSHGSPAMNAAGLLGLAVGHGLIAGADPRKGPATAKDPAIQAGLKSLSQHLDATPPPQKPGRNPAKRVPPRKGSGAETNCYFLWSVERVGVLYNLPIIGDSDWYAWGTEILLPRQREGAWLGGVGNSDTCLALLFLKRANLARDLTGRVSLDQLMEKKD